jgi:hypothetical protein
MLFGVGCSNSKQGGLVYLNDMESVKGWQAISLSRWPVHGGWYSNKLDTAHAYGASFKLPFKEIFSGKLEKVKVSLWVYFTAKSNATLVMEIKDAKEKQLSWNALKMEDQVKQPWKWQKVTAEFSLKIPFSKDPENIVNIYPWDNGGKDIYVDDILIEFVKDRVY